MVLPRLAGRAGEVGDRDAVGAQLDDLVLAELDGVAGVRDERGHIAGRGSSRPRRRPTTSGELRRAAATTPAGPGVHRDQRERALEPPAHPPQRLSAGRRRRRLARSAPAGARRPRCRSRTKLDARRLELGAQPREVLDDAVVDHGELARRVQVRVRVAVGRAAVRRPAGVPDAGADSAAAAARPAPSPGCPACPAACRLQAAVGDQRDAGGVVAAVLQAPQPLDHHVQRRLRRRRTPRSRTWRQAIGALRARVRPPAPAGSDHAGPPTSWLAVRRARPRRLGERCVEPRRCPSRPPSSSGSGGSATRSTSTRSSRSTCRCPAAQPAGRRPPKQLPATTRRSSARRAADTVRHRHRRVGRGRQVDHGAPAAAAARPAGPSTRRSTWSPPTGSCSPTPSSNGAG